MSSPSTPLPSMECTNTQYHKDVASNDSTQLRYLLGYICLSQAHNSQCNDLVSTTYINPTCTWVLCAGGNQRYTHPSPSPSFSFLTLTIHDAHTPTTLEKQVAPQPQQPQLPPQPQPQPPTTTAHHNHNCHCHLNHTTAEATTHHHHQPLRPPQQPLPPQGP